jgi:CBS domain containing-hemolysin-like protein
VLVEDARQAGLLDDDAQERLEDALELGTRPVTYVLLPPEELVTVDATVTPAQVEELTVRTGYSRFPVAGPEGAYLGYLHVKDVLDLEDAGRPVPARLWRPMATLRAELPLDDALTQMRRAASHLASVVDSGGRVLGLVALEDVLEMLVGEVRDPAHREVPEPAENGAAPAAEEPAEEPGEVARPSRVMAG